MCVAVWKIPSVVFLSVSAGASVGAGSVEGAKAGEREGRQRGKKGFPLSLIMGTIPASPRTEFFTLHTPPRLLTGEI